MNTHWAFGTIRLPTWLLTSEDTINAFFQIHSDVAREVMEVARSHLHREYVNEKKKATMLLDDLEGELDADLAITSGQLVTMHTE